MKKTINKIKEKIKNNKKLFANFCAFFVLLCLAIATYAWFNNKAPNMISIMLEDPTTSIVVEKYNEQNQTYDIVESLENEETIEINVDEFKFYKWKDNLVSHMGYDQLYRVTVTNNVPAGNFAVPPQLSLTARYEGTSVVETLLDIRPLKINYTILNPTDSEAFVTTFPSSNFKNLFPNTIPMTPANTPPATASFSENALLFPDDGFPAFQEVVNISEKQKYQTVFYIKLIPDEVAVESVLGDIINLDNSVVNNKIILDFSFRSVPFHTLPPSPTP